jgi:uncharacterized membrane protein
VKSERCGGAAAVGLAREKTLILLWKAPGWQDARERTFAAAGPPRNGRGARQPRPVADPLLLLPKARLEALTDGIFAVAMTLLVLEVKVPAPLDGAGALEDLRKLVDTVDNYLISFVVLAVFWIGHVRVMRRLREPDTTFAVTNLAFAFFTTLVPPLTTYLGDHPDAPRAAVLYGGNLLLLLLCEAMLWRRVCHRLANETIPDAAALWSLVRGRYGIAMGVVVAGIAVALAEIALSPSKGLAPWFYLLLIAAGIVRPPRRRAPRA